MNGTEQRSEDGFTLVEVLIAMVILSVGLVAISNLFLSATASNGLASFQTASASVASQQMELLKELPYTTLLGGGGAVGKLTADVAGCPVVTAAIGTNCFVDTLVPGVGLFHSRWTLIPEPATGNEVVAITVQTTPTSTTAPGLMNTAAAQFTTLRACVNTNVGCP